MTNLGERLKIARDRKGYTQVFVRERTNINNKTLSGYENGVSEPDTHTLSLLADLYEVSYRWLLTGKGNIEENNHIDDNIEYDDELEDFINNARVFYKDEPKNREEWLELMNDMLEVFKKRK